MVDFVFEASLIVERGSVEMDGPLLDISIESNNEKSE